LSGTKLDLVGSAHPAGGPESLYSAADASLRKAKDSGRNRTVGHQKDDAKAGH
jgi:PleD family two-component response regulator